MSIYDKQTNEKPGTQEVIKSLKKNRRLTRKAIMKKTGYADRQVPSFIASLRYRGHLIDDEEETKQKNGKVSAYLYRGMGEPKVQSKQQYKKKKETYNRDDVLKRVPCMICGANVCFYVLKGDDDYDTRRMCQACKDKAENRREDYQLCEGSNGERGGVELSRRISELVTATRKLEREKIKHYRPGDPEFEKIAAQCTPPRDIKDKAGADVVPVHKF